MKIAFNLINFECNEIDGVGNYVKRILNQLQKNTSDNFYILLIPEHFNLDILEVSSKQFHVVRFKTYNSRLRRVLFKFFYYPHLLSKIDVDLIYSPAPPISPLIKRRIKLVTTIHDLTPLKINRGQGFIYRVYYWLIVKIAVTRSDYLTTVSENSLVDICKIFPGSSKKITIISNFICDKTLKLHSSKGFFLFISTIQPGKNLERLIEAFDIFLRDTKLDFKLYVVGRKGWGGEEIIDLTKKLNIESSVIFTGYVNNKELDMLYRECSAVVYPSLYEGFGLPPLEAMYYGKPSVVSNVSSLPEVVGKAGILVDPYDILSISYGMKKIIDKDIRMRLIEDIPNQLAKFDPEIQVNRLLEIFKKTCEKNTNNKRI
jgi:glycosyltransferase involved in cell wall biosynthesis